MKYISTVIFGIALAYTWNLVQQVPAINVQTHAALQTRLAEVIRQSVIEVKPSAKEIIILKVTTEPIDEKSVKAHFSYTFVETDEETGELTQQQVDGDALLKRSQGADPDRDLWTMENVKTNTGAMSFRDGIVITPGMDDAEGVSDTNNPEAEAPAEGSPNEMPPASQSPETMPSPSEPQGTTTPSHD